MNIAELFLHKKLTNLNFFCLFVLSGFNILKESKLNISLIIDYANPYYHKRNNSNVQRNYQTSEQHY